MKNTITEIKNSSDRIKNRLDKALNCIRDLEDEVAEDT